MQSKQTHLLMTCLVTNLRRDGSQSLEDRVEMLYRTLRSLSTLPIDSASFYIEFGSDVILDLSRLEKACQSITSDYKLQTKRLETFKEWREATHSLLKNNLSSVLLLTYEDHEYVRADNQEFNALQNALIKDSLEHSGMKTIAILSHFPEIQIQCDSWQAIGFHGKVGSFAVVPANTPIGCLLVRPKILAGWFETDFTAGKKIVSTENYFGPSVLDGRVVTLVPRQELFRHIDGYEHVGLKSQNRNASPDGLVSRSRTYTALLRTGTLLQFSEYLSLISNLGLYAQIRLSLRSLFFMALSKILSSNWIVRAHYQWMSAHPRVYHQLSTGFSHGIIRYSLHILKEVLFFTLKRFRKFSNITR